MTSDWFEELFIDEAKAALDSHSGTGGGGGVSSWNDLKDKPFDERGSFLVEETTIEVPEDEYGVYAVGVISVELKVGETYKVTWDGVEYECACEEVDDYYIVIGNGTIVGYEAGNNEPFYIELDKPTGEITIYALEAGSHTISIFGKKVYPIDPKYLPEATEITRGAVNAEDVVNFVGHAFNYLDLIEGETTLHELAQLVGKPLGYFYFQDSLFVSFATYEMGYDGNEFITMYGLDLYNLKPAEIKVTFGTDSFEDVANDLIRVRYPDSK